MVMRMSCIIKCRITWPKYQIIQLLVLLPLIYWLQASNSIEHKLKLGKPWTQNTEYIIILWNFVPWLCELSVSCGQPAVQRQPTQVYRGHLKTLLLPGLYSTCNFDLLKYVAYMYHVYCVQCAIPYDQTMPYNVIISL